MNKSLASAKEFAKEAEESWDDPWEGWGGAHALAAIAQAHAAIAQAEQLKRMADAAEQRNKLLVEYNCASQEAAKRHTESIAASASKFVNALYGTEEE